MILSFESSKAERMDTINQRISRLVKREGKQVRFAENCNIRPSTLNMIIGKAKVIPETATIEKILAAYPNVNREWLMSGNGPMLKTGDSLSVFQETQSPYPSKDAAEEIKKTKEQAIRTYLQKKIEESEAKAEAFKRELKELDDLGDIDSFLGLSD